MNLSKLEYYKLVCCVSKTDFLLNGEPVIFEFDGTAYKNNYPDNFFNSVIGNIKTISKISIEGCWELVDASHCDIELYKIIEWKNFFAEAKAYDCCEDCCPPDVVVSDVEIQNLYIDRPADPCYGVVQNYAKIYQADAMLRLEGIKLCCVPNKAKSLIEYNIYIREKNKDYSICCPTCVYVQIDIPAGSVGSYSYVDCNGDTVNVPTNTTEDITQVVCVCSSSYTPIEFIGTTTENFSVIPLGVPCT